jgi:hypothetical protein
LYIVACSRRRCPPTAPAPGQNCYTLPDASDPCCNITVCDKPFLDPDQNVQKVEDVAKDKAPRIVLDDEHNEPIPGQSCGSRVEVAF